MNVQILYNKTTRHKLTVTKDKVEVRIKIAKGTNSTEALRVIQKLTRVADEMPNPTVTMRGRASNKFELDRGLLMRGESKVDHCFITFKSDEVSV